MDSTLLSCPLCLKPHFEGVDALRSSLINVATTHISCPVCNELLLGLDKLTIHLFSHINTITTYFETITTTDGKAVVANQNQNIRDKNVRLSSTEDQSLPVIEIENKFVRCDICNYYFSDQNILDLHQKLLHQTSPDKKTGKCNYHCHLCSKRFRMRGSLMVHMRVAHFGFIQNSNKNSYDDLKIKQDETNKLNNSNKVANLETKQAEKFKVSSGTPKSQENKQWECEVCLKLFTTKYFLKKHKRLHTGEMPYYCSLCNKYFTFQQSYHKHMLYHSDDKPHVCSECGRAFKELSTLHNHQRIHSGERPFSCETCGKSFRQRVSYLVHRRIHTGVMPYKCTACNKNFRYKVSQRSHKCPSSIPGVVIKTTDLIDTQSKNYSLNHPDLNHHLVTNNNTVEEHPNSLQNAPENPNCLINNQLPTSNKETQVFLENNQQLAFINPSSTDSKSNREINKHSSDYNFNDNSKSDYTQPDLISEIFAYISSSASEVQTSCLSNYEDKSNKKVCDDDHSMMEGDVLKTINEESFKELLYGP